MSRLASVGLDAFRRRHWPPRGALWADSAINYRLRESVLPRFLCFRLVVMAGRCITTTESEHNEPPRWYRADRLSCLTKRSMVRRSFCSVRGTEWCGRRHQDTINPGGREIDPRFPASTSPFGNEGGSPQMPPSPHLPPVLFVFLCSMYFFVAEVSYTIAFETSCGTKHSVITFAVKEQPLSFYFFKALSLPRRH